MRPLPALLLFALLLAPAAPARALSVFAAGPSVIHNYPPDNLLPVRVVTTTTSETAVTWGLQGGPGGLSATFGVIRIPAGQFVGFDSQPVPPGFPPGVYTLYASEAGATARGRTFGATPEPPDPSLDSLERDAEAILRAAPLARANLRAFVQGLLMTADTPDRRARLEAILRRLAE